MYGGICGIDFKIMTAIEARAIAKKHISDNVPKQYERMQHAIKSSCERGMLGTIITEFIYDDVKKLLCEQGFCVEYKLDHYEIK